MNVAYYNSEQIWKLPPLILHPFSDAASPNKLAQSSRANLMLQGLLPNDSHSVEQLEEMILEGRICEIRMLFYVGKDVLRWVEQCVDMVDRERALCGSGIEARSFAALLIEDTPPSVKEKLTSWGVNDYRAIFTRALGINAVFAEAPQRNLLCADFIRNYHYFADRMYECWANARTVVRVRPHDFEFELFASGEYSRMLEREWEDQA